MNDIRYKISKGVNQLSLQKNYPFEEEEPIPVCFDETYNYFVDILESFGPYCKMRIYMPDGNIVEGWQLRKWWLSLHYFGDVFDGRFNVGN
jgi:hypothetical protein